MKLRAHIRRNGYDMNASIFLVEERGADEVGFINFDEKGQMVVQVKKIKNGATELEGIKPTFQLHEPIARALLMAFAEAAKQDGIQPASESEIRGELKATKYHLEDMRQILAIQPGVKFKK